MANKVDCLPRQLPLERFLQSAGQVLNGPAVRIPIASIVLVLQLGNDYRTAALGEKQQRQGTGNDRIVFSRPRPLPIAAEFIVDSNQMLGSFAVPVVSVAFLAKESLPRQAAD